MADFVGMLSSLFFRGIHENSELQGALARIILLSFFRPFFLSCLLGPSPSLFFVARNAVAPTERRATGASNLLKISEETEDDKSRYADVVP